MFRNNPSARVLLLALGVASAAAGSAGAATPAKGGKAPAAAQPAAAPQLDQKAVDVLKAASARLAAAKTMTFTAAATYESPSAMGPPLAYTTIWLVTLQRPDKLAVISPGDGPASEFHYDGRTMTAFAPAENLVAVADAPPTIDAMLKAAYDSAAIYYPFTDLVVSDPYGAIAGSLQRAFYIGQSKAVGGVTTDMVGIAGGDGVFAQLWIGTDDKLPRRVRAVYAADPAMLRHDVVLSDWKLDGQVAAETFASAKAAAATKIEFARPDPKPPATFPAAPKGKGGAAKKKQ